MTELKFSVVIPLYNKESYIQKTVESVLNQDYQNFEIIIIDDGSTDNSVSVVKEINSDKIKIVKQSNQGVAVARNKGIETAQNNWIAFLDGDDIWNKGFLKSIHTGISSNDQCIAYATGYSKQKVDRTLFNPSFKSVPKDSGVVDNYFKSCYEGNQIITSSSVCLNKSLLKKQNLEALFPVGIKRGEDLDSWTRLALQNDIYFINKDLMQVQSVEDNVSNSAYQYSESFDYFKWLSYDPDSKEKKKYLKRLVLKKKMTIVKKLIAGNQLKTALHVLLLMIKNLY